MKWNKYSVLLIILCVITVWFTASKMKEASFIRKEYSAVSIRFSTGGVSDRTINKALKNEKLKGNSDIPEVTAWLFIKEAEIKNKDLYRTQKVSVVMTSGNMAFTVPMTLASGNYVYRQDKKGCLIDTKTSYLLFGTEFAVGNTVTYNKKDYIVRGVVRAEYPVLLIQGSGNIKEYPNLELGYKDKQMGETFAEEFLLANQMADNATIIDGYFYGRIIYSLINLPLWIFFFCICCKIYNVIYQISKKQKAGLFFLYIGILLIILIGFGFILYRITGNPFFIPDKLIPSKWSDFDYWTEQSQLMKSRLLEIRYLVPNPKDVYLMDKISKVLLNVIILFHLYIFIYILILMEIPILNFREDHNGLRGTFK
ncbi:ABC transporter permease [Anaerocolumna sp. MB42-C2]|uniref:ABC transporter permease n=1 Tax=Anaerocolumna sp. MB42-C2 TaxID=3070997 RepID=UPI0027E1CB15|nr:ABC transporter permease [Anaerocolumna sp. MB42-C2]WMJ89937.1 ABC transporter permease [Anaerocolumna sp. MB42-C2]